MVKKKGKSSNSRAELKINNKTYTLPIYNSTAGEKVLDVSKLHQESNYFTFDPGFSSTASCESKITDIHFYMTK